MIFTNIAGYQFSRLENLPALKKNLLQLCNTLGLKGTILLSEEGINFFVAGLKSSTEELLKELRKLPACAHLHVKESESLHQPFRRMLIKIKKEIISFGVEGINPALSESKKVTPQELKEWLDAKKPMILLDTRNDYEVRMGTFQGALPVGIRHFRSFPEAVRKLPSHLKEKTIVTFCTGGIRCEKAAPFMEREGFRDVFQLEGGILNYFKECGGVYYEGECFVFDQRVGLNPTLQETESILCFKCQMPLHNEDQKHPHYKANTSCPYCFGKERKAKVRKPRKSRRLKEETDSKKASLKKKSLRSSTIALCFLFLVGWLYAASVSEKPYFLETTSWNFKKIIPSPSNKTPQEQQRDFNLLKDAMAARTKKQLFRALIASSDSLFDYASVIDPRFTSEQLPYTSDFFKKITNDTNMAIHAAKEAFHRKRPSTWAETQQDEISKVGYAYPSGHSTRAFVWAGLLSDLFPEKKKEIEIEARTKAWNRVILGRHYPDDVYAGELYGQYLAKEFLKNERFQQEWPLVKEEIKRVLDAR